MENMNENYDTKINNAATSANQPKAPVKIKSRRTGVRPPNKNCKNTDHVFLRDFPRPMMNIAQAMFPAATQVEAIIAFMISSLGIKAVPSDYKVPGRIRDMVEGAEQGTIGGLVSDVASLHKEIAKLNERTQFLQFLATYAMIHDVGVRKITRSLDEVNMLEDSMFEALSIAEKQFIEYKHVVNGRERRNTNYFKRNRENNA